MTASRMTMLAGAAAGLALSGAVVSAPAPAGAQPIPPGDLSSRCRDLDYRDGAWRGYCRDASGGWRWTTVWDRDGYGGGGYGDDRWDDRYDEGRYGDDQWRDGDQWSDDRYDERRYGGDGWDGGWSSGSITVYADAGYDGYGTSFQGPMPDLRNSGLNDRISSMRMSGDWEVCTDAYFRGDCRLLRGDVRDLDWTNLNDKISSLRPAERRY